MTESLAQKRILVVEDEKPLARALQLKLEAAGFHVDTADNGEIALQKVYAEPFDLVTIDLMMPTMDGFTFLERLKSDKKMVPTIVLSNLSQAEDHNRVLTLGAIKHFVKSDVPIADIVMYIQTFFARQ